jgi:hypothetical protein
MLSRGSKLQQVLVLGLVIVAALAGLFAIALLAAALSGGGFIGSILLGGFGFVLLGLSVVAIIFGIRLLKSSKPS